MTRSEIEKHIAYLRSAAERFGDVGDYARQYLASADAYQEAIDRGDFDSKEGSGADAETR